MQHLRAVFHAESDEAVTSLVEQRRHRAMCVAKIQPVSSCKHCTVRDHSRRSAPRCSLGRQNRIITTDVIPRTLRHILTQYLASRMAQMLISVRVGVTRTSAPVYPSSAKVGIKTRATQRTAGSRFTLAAGTRTTCATGRQLLCFGRSISAPRVGVETNFECILDHLLLDHFAHVFHEL